MQQAQARMFLAREIEELAAAIESTEARAARLRATRDLNREAALLAKVDDLDRRMFEVHGMVARLRARFPGIDELPSEVH